jgi:hypothetical protein
MSRKNNKKALRKEKALKDLERLAKRVGPTTAGGEVKVSGTIQVQETPGTTEQRNADRWEERNYKDHTRWYERKTFWLSLVTAIFTFLYLITTVLIFHQSKRSADAATEAAHATASQLDLSERPWLQVDLAIRSPLIVSKDGISFSVETILKNTGNSPAASVYMESRMRVASDWPFKLMLKEQNSLCDRVRTSVAANQDTLETLFPKTEKEPNFWHVGVTKAELDQASGNGKTTVLPLIFTCVVYRSTFSDTFHETAYISALGTFDPKSPFPGMIGITNKETTINPNLLVMTTQVRAK